MVDCPRGQSARSSLDLSRIDTHRPLNYLDEGEFLWDSKKSSECFRERGFDFAWAARAFFDRNRVIEADRRWPYGEDRFKLTGQIEGRVFVVVFTPRPGAIRIISARKANARERRRYEDGARED